MEAFFQKERAERAVAAEEKVERVGRRVFALTNDGPNRASIAWNSSARRYTLASVLPLA